MWVIYEHPPDMPEWYVARRREITPGKDEPTGDFLLGNTLDAVRDLLPVGLVRLCRDPTDDPVIVEIWL